MKPVLLLMGPTAAGKTALAEQLFDTRPCRLISVDSALVYRGLDIGTAKPSTDELQRYPHALVDICDPADEYSAGHFVRDAIALIDQALAADQLPVLVGGTMLYFRALTRGLADLPRADAELRTQLEAEAAAHGWDALHRQLAEVDPAAAARIHVHDPQRIQRALEVYRLTGRPLSELQQHTVPQAHYDYIRTIIGPTERRELDRRIEQRFDAMLAAGFEQEVAGLMARGELHADLPSMRAVGYRQMWAWLAGAGDFDGMREAALHATRQLAKRQFTWLRGEKDAVWLESGRRVLPDLIQQIDKYRR